MSLDEPDLTERLHAVAEQFEMPPAPLADDLGRGRRRVRRNRALVAGAAAAAVAVIFGITAVVGGHDPVGSDGVDPVQGPTLVWGDVPAVWYDAKGLHHGDVVEQTPIDIVQRNADSGDIWGALALVQTGAVYVEPATDDVWFHPWGGEPRIVGHNSKAGPGGDPNGDTAAWFDGSELVVYDTAAGREISRTPQEHRVAGGDRSMSREYIPPGNGFWQVSAERIVWTNGHKTYMHDVSTHTTVVERERLLVDVHDQVWALGGSGLTLTVPGRADASYPLTSHVRLSPTGNYVLAPAFNYQTAAPAIIDTRTGELWRMPTNAYPWIAWSYDDVALVDTGNELLACDAARRTCERINPDGQVLLPTS